MAAAHALRSVEQETRRACALMLAGGLGAMLGAVLPWAEATTVFGTVTVAGTVGDGKITGGAGIITAAIALATLLGMTTMPSYWLMVAMGGTITAVGGYDLANGPAAGSTSTVIITVGVGLYLTVLAGIAVVVGASLGRRTGSGSPPRSEGEASPGE